jgi:hypothetical protein
MAVQRHKIIRKRVALRRDESVSVVTVGNGPAKQETPPMRIYIIGNDGIILCREPPTAVNEGEVVVASNEELHAARLSGKRLLALWNALPDVEKRKKVGDRDALVDELWSAIETLPEPQSDEKRPSKQDAVIAMLRRPEGATVDEVAIATGWQRHTVRGVFSGTLKKKLGLTLASAQEERGRVYRICLGAGMTRGIQDSTACREALSRLPTLDIGELRQQWRALYKAEASPHLSRELLVRAVAYRMQEVALRGLRPVRQRQLRQIAQQFKQTGSTNTPPRPELKPGTQLVREWQGRTYDVLVLDDGFSWQNTQYRSLSALARKITGTAWSGPLFFGLKPNRAAARRSSPVPGPAGARRVG